MKRLKGLHLDNEPIDQPPGTYSFAQNILLGKKKGAITNEEGTFGSAALPAGTEVIGHTLVYDGSIILFYLDDTGDSVIATFDGDQTLVEVIEDSTLNFQSGSILEAVAVINNKGERVVFWTDNVNPPRYLNIDEEIAEGSLPRVIGDLDRIKLFPTINSAPFFEFGNVTTGGSLRSGSYHFAVRLIASDDSVTGYMNVSPPVYITDDTDGAVAGTLTSKLIQMNIENLDTTFDQFQVAVIRKEQGTIAEVIQLEEQDIDSESSVVTYQGTEGEEISLDEVLINTADYETARTIIEQDNTIYLGNLTKESTIDFQPYANNIVVKAAEKDLDEGINNSGNFRNNEISFYDKSFKRGEVYALYVSFVLPNGSETRAFHIPGRASEGTEKDVVTGELATVANFNYQINSDAGTNGMAFWENENEVYPSTDRWATRQVNSSGVGIAKDTLLQGANVRHHHFPDGSYYNDADTKATVLGFTLENFFIPNDIIDQIVGVKVYYAEHNTANQRILDQGYLIPMSEVDHGGVNYYGFDPYQSKDNNDDYSAVRAARFNSFHASRTQKAVGNATHIKVVGIPQGTATDDFNDGSNNDELQFNDQSLNINYTIPSAKRYRQIKDQNAITYLERNQLVNGTSLGFDFDLYNLDAENGIAMQFANSLDMSDVSYNIDDAISYPNLTYGYIAELWSYKTDVYENFGAQELVWTGKLITDLTVFSKTAVSPIPDVAAEGVLTITGAADASTGVPATAEFTYSTFAITGLQTVTFTVDINGVTATDTIVDPDQDTAAALVASIINTAPAFSGYTATAVGATVTVTGATGTGDNGKIIDVTTDNLVPVAGATLSGGEVGNLTVSILNANIGLAETETIPVANNATKDTIATDIFTALNGNISIIADYTLVLNTVPADPTITITADTVGSDYNAGISVNIKETGVTFTENNIVGGSSSAESETGSGIVSATYGGDTFISVYGTRFTGTQSSNADNDWRILVKLVNESYDNIELRHEGGNNWEIYYPKSTNEAVLSIEGDPETGESASGTANHIAYNPDYSAKAVFKVATPVGFTFDQLTKFPTRIIRSLQGDTNVGEDIGLRTFLENDFIDLTRKRGELVKLSILQNVIIPHMERAVIRTKARQEMLVGDIRAFVGAGDIFAVDPDEITTTEAGFGGLQDQRCALSTPYGYFFVDRNAGEAILLGEQPEIISDYGLHNFFSENIATIANDNTLLCTYDPEWKRIIVTGGGYTLSYYPERKVWGSFHTYQPDYYFHDVDTFFSIFNDDINEHNVATETGFIYGSAAPMIFEFIDNRSPEISKYCSAVKFDTEVYNGTSYIYNETFNTIRVSNTTQDSGDVTLTPYTYDTGNCRHIEGKWFTNDFRDLIDNGSINASKPWYEQARFISEHIRIRFTYNNTEKKSLYLHAAEALFRVSKR